MQKMKIATITASQIHCYKGYDVPYLTTSCFYKLSMPSDTYDCCLLVIGLPRTSIELLYMYTFMAAHIWSIEMGYLCSHGSQ